MSGKVATTLSLILLVLLLMSLNMATGCTSGTPSEGDMGEAIFTYITRSAAGVPERPCHNPEVVEVIEVEETTEKNKMTTWSVTVNVICSNEEVQAQYIIVRDTLGNLKVLRRTA
jgi:hypothetical protein